MASGNLFKWTHQRTASKGGIRGEFLSEPSQADMQEARDFCTRQVPPDSRFLFDGVGDEQTSNAILDLHLTGGSRN